MPLSPALSPEGEREACRFSGYAAVFDCPDRGGDVVRRGAFAGAGAVPLLWEHGAIVGRIEAVAEDGRGLRVAGVVEDARAAALVAAGALTGLSFGYRARAVRHGVYRELLAVELVEVSLVAQPMQRLARVDA
ncbi:HK97 family phage prohead protease [Sphingomonas sp. S1-29]|uniref:HK97 family phage prohead protease n=1 Tax=Sphingomonas sp. S1-29 TaxID=2991074 RepID=UPI002240749F|nr:HK97 family phage prohead protease [Sphingomonas sp. S1-29]UZK71086.1 HK97 family phage prohead protease [Sphingomonas sp. S1-29]